MSLSCRLTSFVGNAPLARRAAGCTLLFSWALFTLGCTSEPIAGESDTTTTTTTSTSTSTTSTSTTGTLDPRVPKLRFEPIALEGQPAGPTDFVFLPNGREFLLLSK